MAVLPPDVIAFNKLQIIVGAPLPYFGVLTSAMHMGWMRTVGGRLKSDYSYSPSIVCAVYAPLRFRLQAEFPVGPSWPVRFRDGSE